MPIPRRLELPGSDGSGAAGVGCAAAVGTDPAEPATLELSGTTGVGSCEAAMPEPSEPEPSDAAGAESFEPETPERSAAAGAGEPSADATADRAEVVLLAADERAAANR